MKILKNVMLIAMAGVLISSCKSDDNKGEELLPIAVRNEVDDQAIVKYLKEHYFNEKGIATRFSEEDASDDNEKPLYDLATRDESGYWYVKRPGVAASGASVTNNNTQEILLQYNFYTYQASENKEDNTVSYGYPILSQSTINTTGYPVWNPLFYYGGDQAYDRRYYEIKGFVEGIKHFSSANRERKDVTPVNFQGLIIMPSRLAYGREGSRPMGIGRDYSVIVNFELYQVKDR